MNVNPIAWAASTLRLFTRIDNDGVNRTVPVTEIKELPISFANMDIALVAKGTGATLAQVPDGTLVGGNKRGDYATDWQKTRNVGANVASGTASTLSGGSVNTASGATSTVGGGFGNSASGTLTVVAGGESNTASGSYAFVGGGSTNTASSNFSFIGGGSANVATSSTYATICGGSSNSASGQYSFVGGGAGNIASTSTYATVCGGNGNTASGSNSFIGGGISNTASALRSAICGGSSNTASASFSFIGGGASNTASGQYSTVAGGDTNSATSTASFVGGGARGTTRGIIGYNVSPSCDTPISGTLGVTQSALLLLGRQTTDATATVLASNNSAAATSNQVTLPDNSAYSFSGEVIAGVTGAGNSARWTIDGAIKRGANAASTVMVGTPTVVMSHFDAGAATWVVAVTANTTLGCITVTVTGAAATTIRWVCRINTVEMTY
jgi:hypothetical protein